MIQWTIGTTTVRNPDRLRDGLQLFSDRFDGELWDESAQRDFFDGLVERGIYELDSDALGRMKPPRKQEHTRKWVSVLNQLGFCRAYKGSVHSAVLTDAGRALLASAGNDTDIFLRQIWKYQKPAPLPNQSGPSFDGVAVRPGWVSLKVARDLHAEGLIGISREEMALFLTTTLRNELAGETVEAIRRYRHDRTTAIGQTAKRRLFIYTLRERVRDLTLRERGIRAAQLREIHQHSQESRAYARSFEADAALDDLVRGGKGSRTLKAQEYKQRLTEGLMTGIEFETLISWLDEYHESLRMDTLRDYTDLTSRYLRKMGLFTVRGDKLAIMEDRQALIEELADDQPDLENGERYLESLWSSRSPRLPSDDMAFLRREVREIQSEQERVIQQYPELTLRLMAVQMRSSNEAEELRSCARALRQNLSLLREMEFFHRQSQPDQIRDILDTFDRIERRELLGGEAYRPAYYEWAVWRFLLAVSSPVDGQRRLEGLPEETRGFRVDDAMQPLHHAAAGAADMLFAFQEYLLVVEATLHSGPNQWSAEGEPVPRHVGDVLARQSRRAVFGLFIAPSIDKNTALTFHRCRHYVNGRITDLSIVPMTTDQYKNLALAYLERPFGPDDLKTLLDQIDEARGNISDPLDWIGGISALISDWRSSLIRDSGQPALSAHTAGVA